MKAGEIELVEQGADRVALDGNAGGDISIDVGRALTLLDKLFVLVALRSLKRRQANVFEFRKLLPGALQIVEPVKHHSIKETHTVHVGMRQKYALQRGSSVQ